MANGTKAKNSPFLMIIINVSVLPRVWQTLNLRQYISDSVSPPSLSWLCCNPLQENVMSNLVGLAKSAALVTKCLLLWGITSTHNVCCAVLVSYLNKLNCLYHCQRNCPESAVFTCCRITIKTIYGQNEDIPFISPFLFHPVCTERSAALLNLSD